MADTNHALFPYEYVIECLDIANANNMSWDIGLDMFLNNIRDIQLHKEGKDPYWYPGADQLDYEALQKVLDEVGDVEMAIRKNTFVQVYRQKALKEYAELRRAGKNKELKEMFINDVAQYPGLPQKAIDGIIETARSLGYDVSAWEKEVAE